VVSLIASYDGRKELASALGLLIIFLLVFASFICIFAKEYMYIEYHSPADRLIITQGKQKSEISDFSKIRYAQCQKIAVAVNNSINPGGLSKPIGIHYRITFNEFGFNNLLHFQRKSEMNKALKILCCFNVKLEIETNENVSFLSTEEVKDYW
jgi:hypothetical protein